MSALEDAQRAEAEAHVHSISMYWTESYRPRNSIKAKQSKSNVCECGAIYALEHWYIREPQP